MSFHKSVGDMISRYGSDVCVQTGEKTVKTKAFVQPLRYKIQYTQKRGYVGKKSDDYYLYIGKSDCVLDSNIPSIVMLNDEKYVVHNTKSYVFNNEILYVWAVLRPYYGKRRDDYGPDQ